VSYVLVCLVGDEATHRASDFGRWLEQQEPRPRSVLFEPHPAHVPLQSSVTESKTLFVIGHNGRARGVHSLRAEAAGQAWIRGEELGMRFAGARVFAWACETVGEEGTRIEGVAHLGDEAVSAGLKGFAGFSIRVPGDLEFQFAQQAEHVRRTVHRMALDFFSGLGVAEIKLNARESFAEALGLVIVQQPAFHDLISNFYVVAE
jgi:hypothetical protein